MVTAWVLVTVVTLWRDSSLGASQQHETLLLAVFSLLLVFHAAFFLKFGRALGLDQHAKEAMVRKPMG